MKKIAFILILTTSLLIIKNLVVSIYSLWQKQDLMVQAQEQLKSEKEKNTQLSEKLKQADSPGFVEQQARDKLFMVKDGEQEILISKRLLQPASNQPQKDAEQHWQQWLDLFF